jgi:hypothetical protein
MVSSLFQAVMLQTLYYVIVCFVLLFLIAMLLRGFFWNYIKVRTSFGKYFLIKIRNPIRDYFTMGKYEDGFMIFKHHRKELKVPFPENLPVIYRCLAVSWVDYDEKSGSFVKADFSAVTSYDARKFNNLYLRALTLPQIASGFEKVLIILMVISLIFMAIVLYFNATNYANIKSILKYLAAQAIQSASVTPGAV